MQIASTFASSQTISGNSLATFFASSKKRPSAARTTFALWTIVTFFRPNFRVYSKAARTMRDDPLRVFTLQEIAYSSLAQPAKGANGFESFARTSDSSFGTGENSTPA